MGYEFGTVSIAVLLALSMAATFASGQENVGKVYGHVYGADEGLITGATVTIVYEDNILQISIITDENNYYEFDDLSAGRYEIEFRAEGFETYWDTFSLSSGENREYDVKLEPWQPYPGEGEPDAVIKGYVRDVKTGGPTEGASVSISGGFRILEETDIFLPPERWGGYNSTTTDENGYYEMKCWSGESWVYAYAEGYREYSAQVTIAENEVKQHDIQLEPKPPRTAKISGYVRDRETGKPIAGRQGEEFWMEGAWINLSNQEEPDWSSAQTDENGYYELITYPGYCTIDIWANAYYPYRMTVDLEENESMTLDFSLKPRPSPDSILHGHIRDVASGKPIEGAWVYAWNEERFAWGEGRTDENGYYEIKLVHGYHSISAWAENYFSNSTVFEIVEGEKLELNLSLKLGGEPIVPYLMREALAPPDWSYGPMRGDEESGRQWYAVDQAANVTLTPQRSIGALVVILIVLVLAVPALAYGLRRR